MEKPKLDLSGWNLYDLEGLIQKALLDRIGVFIYDILTHSESFVLLEAEGIRVALPPLEEDELSVVIPWGWPLNINETMPSLTALFGFLRKQLDMCGVSEEDRAKLRAILD